MRTGHPHSNSQNKTPMCVSGHSMLSSGLRPTFSRFKTKGDAPLRTETRHYPPLSKNILNTTYRVARDYKCTTCIPPLLCACKPVLSNIEAFRPETLLVGLDELLALVFSPHDHTIVSSLRGREAITGRDSRERERRTSSVVDGGIHVGSTKDAHFVPPASGGRTAA